MVIRMQEIIKNDNELCVGCNRCVRECPMEMANITYQDEAGNIKVKLDYEKCINCGRCLSACKHKARIYDDDTGRFFDDLASGISISVIAAPSIRTNIPEYKRLFTYLKKSGVNKIYDVSYGADICTWAHIRHIEKNGAKPLITQPCPAVVSYCEIYRHDLLEYLSPIHSPMACTAIHMKQYEGMTDRIAAISPCIAKSDEFSATGLAQYNVTFVKLCEYMEKHGIVFPEEETGFDNESGLGAMYPTPGGLKENIEYYLGKDIHISSAEGFGIFEKLNTYAKVDKEILPEVFDVLSCIEGCNIGSACSHESNIFEIDHVMKNSRKTAMKNRDKERSAAILKEYDEKYDLASFLREYSPVDISHPELTDEDIENAFELLGKDDFEKRNVNCSACGSETCYQMARKLALGVNIPVNCIVKAMEDARAAHEENLEFFTKIVSMEKTREAVEQERKMMREVKRRDTLLETVSRVADILLATENSSNIGDSISKSIELVGHAVDVDHVQIWKNDDINGQLHYVNTYAWSSELGKKIKSVPLGLEFPYSAAPGWEKIFTSGEHINSPISKLPLEQQIFLEGYDIKTIAMIPLFIHGQFWGFFDLSDCHQERYFLEDEINILRSASLMMANALLRDEAMRSIRVAVEEARAANQAKSMFLSNMSHEIRTPMNAILGITEIQFQNETLSPEAKEAFDKIYSSGDMLLGIINDILDLSKIEAGKLELVIGSYNTASMINDTAQLNMMRIGSKPIEFKLEVDENFPAMLQGDELRVKQILNNLLSNAFKYTEKGRVTLGASVEQGVNPDRSGVAVIFRVSDTGQGMTNEQIERLFDEYTRFNQQANRSTEGTGLGMSIAQNIIRLMNGSINVKSEPGKGTVFTVRLPQGSVGPEVLGRELAENLRQFRLSSKEQMKRVQISRESMPYGSVLIVDDVETNIYVAKGLLAPYSLKIDSADSGPKAIEKINNGAAYDIVFMDHMMPGMDGIEATKIIRGLGYKGTIVALTANALAGQAEIFLENGFDDFISKPIDLRQLNTVLNKFVRDKKPAQGGTMAVSPAVLPNGQATDEPAQPPTDPPTDPPIDPRFAEIFVRDANKALAALENICENDTFGSEDGMRSYIINVHGMKSALANIGQTKLSGLAAELELAARNGDTGMLSPGTREFNKQLRALTERLVPKPAAEKGAQEKEDRQYLLGKLKAVKAACEEYDKKTVKDILAGLEEKTWSQPTAEILETLAEHLLHSDFEEIAVIVDKIISA